MTFSTIDFILLALLSFVPSVIDSSFGMGYGFIVTPLLLILGYNPLQIIPSILVSSIVGNLLSSIFHHKFRNVDFSLKSRDFKIALVIGVFGSIGSLFGALLAVEISKFHLSLYIGIMVLTIGLFILYSRKIKFKFSWLRMTVLGVIGAFNKGISGSGFGPIVTTGGLLSGLSEKITVSIQSLSELFASTIGLVTFIFSGVQIDAYFTIAVSTGVAVASPLAAFIVKRSSGENLRWMIALTAILLGLFTLIRAFL
jgi:uncharacterized membrane protein YfcA